MLTRAEWEWSQGSDPLRHLDQAIQHLEASRGKNPGAVYAYFLLAHAHVLKARRCMAVGKNPGTDLSAALEFGKLGLRVTSSHFKVHLALVEVQEMQALDAINRGHDPTPYLEEARRSLRAGLMLNPSDYRLHLQGAQAWLISARYSISNGHSPLAALVSAETIARRGLSVKGDCPGLWLALAKVERYRAEWARIYGIGDPSTAAHAGLKDLQRVISINPSLPEVLAEKATLELFQARTSDRAHAVLSYILNRHPFLKQEYNAYL